MNRFLGWGITLALSLFAMLARAEDSSVRLCADQWMPYNGDPAATKPGYVVELARAIFEPKGIKVDYDVMSYEEALSAVKEGRRSGAIGANKDEAKGLNLPDEPIGAVASCLITLADSKWTYDNVASFRSAKLGVIKGYTYWPALDTYIERNAGSGCLFVAAGEDPLEELMVKLQKREIDVVAESEPILLWYLRSHNLDRAIFRVVFKGTVDPIFVAFSPNEDGKRFAAILDEGIRELRKSGELAKLLQRYGLRDWQ
jgi:polar amino acid transport system substrate-binding protein